MAELFIELFSEEIPTRLQIDARAKIKQSIEEDGWWCNELHIKHHMRNNNIKVTHANLMVFGHKGT